MNRISQFNRRLFLGATSGIAGTALTSLLAKENARAESFSSPDGKPHFRPKAKSVIWLFMRGGVSHMESFDPKPALNQYAGQTISETPFSEVQTSDKLKRVRVVVVNDANGQQLLRQRAWMQGNRYNEQRCIQHRFYSFSQLSGMSLAAH